MKGKNVKLKRTDPLEGLKMEIAAELGLIDQVRIKGWHSLSAKDAGKIGGLMTQRMKSRSQQENGNLQD
ncbi:MULTISPECIES: small, acid-soluble spore protein, alpha/beta type [Desulfitobacterium]|uniref:Small, acid-soluble spore protein, alpha/beta type n=2 Tax=Desulfitobacterium dehalogenans TaxID=36854 RepID=I4A8M8_DESDJ|nr:MULTISPECIES: small, acid-soluble spore protein, alpha/beta type [Desulfitobacterium]AFM00313.1 small, acid-soluble spore protein, alpha/beta type [Desulfitobacterium dehalogenans ATCC 51507]HHY27502.1 small, acid-soluble spore protein, alpha/beta type [Desulfitobacterium dehalogenans]